MTPKEALENVKHEIQQRLNDMVVDGCDLGSVLAIESFIRSNLEVIEKALTELERLQKKEVPMKVNITNPMDDWHPCPNCGYLVLHSIDKHCSTCGQKLDWSDEK